MRQRIGEFLLRRLAEVGTTHVFGVPGDYNMSFLEQLEAHRDIDWVGTCNELNASYAADGYARSGRPGVLLTTYAVGCLSAINGVAGAYCENVPLIHISGSPPVHAVDDRMALHHSLLDGGYRNIHRAFTEFTEYADTISTANAVDVIDHALVTAFRSRRPVRLELPSDLTHIEIDVPAAPLDISETPCTGPPIDDAARAVAEALAASVRPLLFFDLPAVRWGAVDAIERFCAALDIPFACTGPAVHQADSAQFIGMLPSAAYDRQSIFAQADLVIACALTRTDVTTGGFTLDLGAKSVVRLLPTYTQSSGAVFYGTDIATVLDRTQAIVAPDFDDRARWWTPPVAGPRSPSPATDDPITAEHFFTEFESFVRTGDVVIAETGTSAQNITGMSLPPGIRYINQSSWGSIGYALPALLGALVSSPQRRHILCTGDGSVQLTAQELSTIIRHGFAPIIFLLNNRGYTIERSILGATSPYNDVADWSYPDLARVFGIDEARYLSRTCRSRSELAAALAAAAESEVLTFIEVKLEPLDMNPPTTAVGESTRAFDYGFYGPTS